MVRGFSVGSVMPLAEEHVPVCALALWGVCQLSHGKREHASTQAVVDPGQNDQAAPRQDSLE